MNTKSYQKVEELIKRFDEAFAFKSEEETIEHEAQMLMFEYLSAAQKVMEKKELIVRHLQKK